LRHCVPILCCLLLASSCATLGDRIVGAPSPDPIDPNLGLDRTDYYNMFDTKKNAGVGTSGDVTEPPIPELADILAAPQPPKISQAQLVSIAVTDDVPLKDVFIELARLADVDIEIDAGITGGVSFRAKDRPFNEVIERITDMAGLRYTMKDNVLRIERDAPFIQIYALDFLNIERSSDNSISLATNVLSNSGGGGGGTGLTSGSTSSITSKTTSDFWAKFEEGITQIIAYQPTRLVSTTTVASQIAPAAPRAPGAAAAGGGAGGEGGGNVLPTPVPTAATTAAPASTGSAPGYILNRQASTLTVNASEKQHQLIRRFLDKLTANATSQVLIDAKIVEVTLNNDYQSGIDWSKLDIHGIDATAKFGAVSDAANIFTFNFQRSGRVVDLASAVQMTEVFGTTRTLSSPRLHATNNQQSVLTFAENQVYFTLEITQSESSSTTTTTSGINRTTVTSTIHTVPIGIILSLQPSINLETNEVTLSVRPTLSRVTTSVSDPAVAYLLAQDSSLVGLSSQIPVIEVRELDSILKLKSGQVMVIGGLMQDASSNTESGVPGLSSVPFLGNAFKGVDKDNETKELVIFIRATIVDSNGNPDKADKTIYEKFTDDPRPLKF